MNNEEDGKSKHLYENTLPIKPPRLYPPLNQEKTNKHVITFLLKGG